MANAILAMQQDPKGPQGLKPAAQPVVAEVATPVIQATAPDRAIRNSGTPDNPIAQMSAGVRALLAEAANHIGQPPQSVTELPGGIIRTDH